MGVLSELEPRGVFACFERLCAVPHGSGNTKQISDLCVEMAGELGLQCRQEPCNNVIIRKPGSPGYENAAPVILQGHLDMVCVKTEGCGKDLTREGPEPVTDGEWVWAKDTSLGGDDGIAVAMIFAVLADETLPHPPIEAVLTVDEETGMDGAFALDMSDLKGTALLNLDSEEEGVFTVSCAGGVHADCFLPGVLQPLTGEVSYRLRLSGLQGGHSGTDIDKGRANANALMGRVLCSAAEQIPGLRLGDIRGGRFHNVICPMNEALAAVPPAGAAALERFVRDFGETLRNEYAGCDDGLTLEIEAAAFDRALDAESSLRLLRMLVGLPQGVLAMSADFPGLVETSVNLGVMDMDGQGLRATLSVRSCIASRKEMAVQRIRAVAAAAGAEVAVNSGYPGWQYRRSSPLRERVEAAYRALTGKEGIIAATHGGLECGLFLEKKPELDVVSVGPELRDIHSVRERLNVASTARLYALVCEVLKRSR